MQNPALGAVGKRKDSGWEYSVPSSEKKTLPPEATTMRSSISATANSPMKIALALVCAFSLS
jgi:hypothetical protein